MTDPLRYSVVICTYSEKRWDELVAAVASLRTQTLPPEEIIIVVDHNPALATRVWRELPDVIAVDNPGRQGLSDARNSGLAVAHGDVVVFLDDDAVADPHWLEYLAEGYRDPDVVGVGGYAEAMWAESRPRWFPTEFDWVVGCTYRGMPTEAAPVRNLMGCNMSFRREVFAEVGGFTPHIGRLGTKPVGCEETELCIRIGQRHPQAVILFDPRAVVHHNVPASRARFSYFRSRCYAEGLSKAAIAALVGAEDGLSAERRHTVRILPAGVLAGLRAALRGDVAGIGRAGAIIAGVSLAAVGYVLGRIAPSRLAGVEKAPASKTQDPVPSQPHDPAMLGKTEA
jgi:GT2 family glycosyltransferase